MSKQSRRPNRAARHAPPPRSTAPDVRRRIAWSVAAVAVVGVVAASFLAIGGGGTSGGTEATVGSLAPSFAGRDVVSGHEITSAGLTGRNVLYFFNEGVGCQACMVQIQALQEHAAHLRRAHLTLVSVTNDDAGMLAQAAVGYRITTPLVPDPTRALTRRFGALGGGMHADTADHTFILVDRSGRVRFHADFPTMWIDPNALLKRLPKV